MYSVVKIAEAALAKAFLCSGRSVILSFPQDSTCIWSTLVTSYSYSLPKLLFIAWLFVTTTLQNPSSYIRFLAFLAVVAMWFATLLTHCFELVILKAASSRKSTCSDIIRQSPLFAACGGMFKNSIRKLENLCDTPFRFWTTIVCLLSAELRVASSSETTSVGSPSNADGWQ